jgi:carboxymethylenebutenolidase
LFYGIGEADFGKVKSKILGHFSDNDEWEPMEGVRWLEQSLKEAGVDATLHIYPGVAHWFVESDRPEYDSAAAQLAWERTYKFLKENL